MNYGKTDRRRNIDGLNVGERAVLALWDDGVPIERIARHLSVSRSYAANAVSQYCGNEEDRNHRTAMRRGSQVLLTRLQAAGGHR